MEATNLEPKSCFSCREIEENIYLIREVFNVSENVCNIWLLKGTILDVVIDTGLGLWDLPKFLRSEKLIGDTPVLAVATHIHFDHTGGMHQFEEQAIHTLEYNELAVGNGVAMVSYLRTSDVTEKPSATFRCRDYKVKPVTPTRALEDGDIIDLGDQKLHVLHLPGHSKGSIALFEPENGYLFAGDVIYDGMLLDFLPGSCVEDYVHSFERLQEMAPRITKIFPGHFGILSGNDLLDTAKSYIRSATCCSKSCKKCLKCLV